MITGLGLLICSFHLQSCLLLHGQSCKQVALWIEVGHFIPQGFQIENNLWQPNKTHLFSWSSANYAITFNNPDTFINTDNLCCNSGLLGILQHSMIHGKNSSQLQVGQCTIRVEWKTEHKNWVLNSMEKLSLFSSKLDLKFCKHWFLF
jgi:hypothetical protein